MMQDEALSIVKTGAVIAFTGTSASVAIPTDSSGSIPKYVRISVSEACYVKIGASGVVAADGDVLVHPAESIILKTGFAPYIAAIQFSAAGTVQISPLEDQ